MPRNKEPRIDAIQIKVIPAFLLRGSLNAVIPFEMASTPVNAVVPLANACRIKKGVIRATVSNASISGGLGTVPSVWLINNLKKPYPTVKYIITTKKYVGMAKAVPDSFTPRKLISMMNMMKATEITTRKLYRSGKADVICATPEAIDTDTVSI